MKTSLIYVLILSFFVIYLGGCKTKPNSPVQAELKVLHGNKASDLDYDHPGIVKLNFYQLNDRSTVEIKKQPIRPLKDALANEKVLGSWICTASFISDSILVTAAHCFHHLSPSNIGENLFILLSDQNGDVLTSSNGGPVLGTKAIINNQYNTASSDLDNVAHDLALIYCTGIKSKEVLTVASDLSAEVGDEVTLFGYGQHTLDGKSPDVLMTGKNTLADISSNVLMIGGSTKNSHGAVGLEGDSGSPIIDSHGIIIGIASLKLNDEKKYPGKIYNFYVNITNSSAKQFFSSMSMLEE